MRPLVAAVAALALLAPAARAQAPAPDFPADLVALLPGWIEEVESQVTADDKARPWWPEAELFLAKAHRAQEEGRLRSVLFHTETFEQLLLTNRLLDEARGIGASSEAKSVMLQRTGAWHDEAVVAWVAFRAKLHEYDGQLRSLHTLEKALYAADLAVAGGLNQINFDQMVREFASQPGYNEGHVFALVSTSHTPLRQLERAQDVFDVALHGEGVPPRIDDADWTNLTAATLAQPSDARKLNEPLVILGDPVRANGEGTMAVAILLAEQRALRATNIVTIYGDAETRGMDVVRDAGRAMDKELNGTSLELPRSYGLLAVFTSDALDAGHLMREYIAQGNATLHTIISTWAGLEHQKYATNALAHVSPIAPPPTPTARTPGLDVTLLIALAALAALARRR